MKSTLFYGYLAVGLTICILFGVAANAGWRIPSSGMGGSAYFGRSYGGSWGGGK